VRTVLAMYMCAYVCVTYARERERARSIFVIRFNKKNVTKRSAGCIPGQILTALIDVH